MKSKIKNNSGFKPYSDPVTNAHEMTHEIHADIRLKYCKPGQNGFLLPNKKVITVYEPKFKKSAVAEFIPANLRGKHFQHYVVESKDWEDHPSYLFDEWIAYYNGAKVGVERFSKEAQSRDVVTGLLELMTYSFAMVGGGRKLDRRFYDSSEGEIYRQIVQQMYSRSYDLVSKAMRIPELHTKDDLEYFRKFNHWMYRLTNKTKKLSQK